MFSIVRIMRVIFLFLIVYFGLSVRFKLVDVRNRVSKYTLDELDK